jgi:dTDP-4-dehydrorhamnose reductase
VRWVSKKTPVRIVSDDFFSLSPTYTRDAAAVIRRCVDIINRPLYHGKHSGC